MDLLYSDCQLEKHLIAGEMVGAGGGLPISSVNTWVQSLLFVPWEGGPT